MSDVHRIPLSEPHLAGNELRYIRECIETNFVSSVGRFVDRFERSVASYLGARSAVAAVNGTAALHIALLIAGVGPDDEVLVSDLTFVAPANAVRYVGAWPVFIDAEPEYFEMDAARAVDFLEKECRWVDGALRNRVTGRRVGAILPVHVLGHPCDLDPILEVASRYGIAVIEDATESLGSTYKDRMTGTLGRVGCLSFNGNKIITTGGGGMIITNDEELGRKAKYLTTQAKDDPLEYIHNEVGYNYRLTNLLAAVGVAQMEQLPSFIEKKRHIATIYAEQLRDVPGIRLMKEAPWSRTNFWLYTVLVDAEAYGMTSRELMLALREDAIESRPLWTPMHLLPAHKGSQAIISGFSESLHQRALSLPCSVGLTDEDILRVADRIARIRVRTPV